MNVSFVAAVFCCLFFGEKLFSGGGDGVVKGWDMTSGGEILSLEGHREEVVSKKMHIVSVVLELVFTSGICV